MENAINNVGKNRKTKKATKREKSDFNGKYNNNHIEKTVQRFTSSKVEPTTYVRKNVGKSKTKKRNLPKLNMLDDYFDNYSDF